MKVRPDVGTPLAAGLANEACLEIGNPDVIRPLIRADRDREAAVIVRAVDHHAACTPVSRFSPTKLTAAIIAALLSRQK